MSQNLVVSSVWGKTNYKANNGQWHSLICHLLDVAACAKSILWREPETTRKLHADDLGFNRFEEAEPWILLFVALHDIGKATPSFQQKANTKHWKFLIKSLEDVGLEWRGQVEDIFHGQASQYLIGRWEYFEEVLNIDKPTLLLIAQAVGAHHGYRDTNKPLDTKAVADVLSDSSHQPWIRARQEILEELIRVLKVDVGKPPRPRDERDRQGLTGAAFFRLMGLTSFADWLGSDSKRFNYTNGQTSDYDAYFKQQCRNAEAVLNAIGWHERQPIASTKHPIEEVFHYLSTSERPFRPNVLQITVSDLAEGIESPALLLIEAPMGEGKTEAAFYAHLRLQAQLGHRGMYMGLPTQATGNQLFARTVEFLEEAVKLEQSRPVDAQLLHGMNLVNQDYKTLQITAVNNGGGDVRAHEWFTGKKQGLLSEYGVGTVDQALLAILGVRHQFVRLWGLGNRTVIIDEVHAYDTYTSGLIKRLVEWLHALGSSVILMSATLPTDKRKELLGAYGAREDEIPEKPAYPRITRVCGGEVRTEEYLNRVEMKNGIRKQEIELTFTDADIQNLSQQLKLSVDGGGCAVSIVNTVKRAQQLYREIGAGQRLLYDSEGFVCGKQVQDVEIYLFHARYPGDERKARENWVKERFGKQKTNEPSKRPTKAILIATQVVEQSLDLDFDVMFTDLAPIDLILQRGGRLWRHDRNNRSPSQVAPRLYVAVTVEDGLPKLESQHDRKGKLREHVIYEQYIQLLTWWFLRRDFIEANQKVTLPSDIDRLVQVVYGFEQMSPSLPQLLVQALEDAKTGLDHRCKLADTEWQNVVIGAPNGSWSSPPRLKRDDDVEDQDPKVNEAFRAVTRQGEPTITAIPLFEKSGQYYLDLQDSSSKVDLEKTPRNALKIFERNVKLQREDVVKALGSKGIPKGWAKEPLLRNCYALKLDQENKRNFWWTRVKFDVELGVVYESTKQRGENEF